MFELQPTLSRCCSEMRPAVFIKSIRTFGQCRVQATHKFSTSIDVNGENQSLDHRDFTDFKKHLRISGIQHKDGHTCLQLECRLCNRDEQRRQNVPISAYVNKKTGSVFCPSCDVKQSLTKALKIYQNPENRLQQEVILYKSNFPSGTEVSPEICDRLGIKGLKSDQLTGIGAQYVIEYDLLHFNLRNAAQQIVGEKVLYLLDKREETYQRTGNTGSGLLIHGPQNRTKAVVVNNLLDFIVLATQQIDSHCIVCLPYGLKQMPQDCLPALERFKELIFWFNFDSTGWDAARSFAYKMDEKRCLFIRPTETEPAPSLALRKRYNLRHILAKATPVLHKSITTFSALRNDILSELQNIEKVNGVKWKRFPVLNKLLKGHRKGELTILTGPTGSGKTTFVSEYSLDLAMQGVSTLWGSFEIRNSRLASTLLRQFVGYPLNDKLNEFEYWATQFEQYPLYFMTFHGQQPLKVVMEAIEHAQYINDISHVIIDNLQFMMGISSSSFRNDKFWEQDAIIAAFRAFATKHNVHVTLVMHPRKERQEDDLTTSSVFGTAKATQEADNVLIIQDKRLTSVRGKKYLQIVKNRYSGDLGVMPLEFDKDALSYATANSAKRRREREKSSTESL